MPIGLVIMIIMTSGAACAPVAAAALRIVMAIGTQVVIAEGAKYVEELIDPNKSSSPTAPVVRINHADSSGANVSISYEIHDVDAISISALEGDVHLSGNGRLRVVSVAPGSRATIEIVQASTTEIDVNVRSSTTADSGNYPPTPTNLSPGPTRTTAARHNPPPNAGGSAKPPPTTPAVDPPATPTDVTAIATSATTVHLQWTDNSSDETGFAINSFLGGTGELIRNVAANTTAYDWTGLSPNTMYCFNMWALKGGASSAHSEPSCVVTPAA